MTIEEVVARCKLACGSEAVVRGFPDQLGYEICDGSITDDLDEWSDDQYLAWISELKAKYRIQHDESLMQLYVQCSEILGSYAPLLQQCQG